MTTLFNVIGKLLKVLLVLLLLLFALATFLGKSYLQSFVIILIVVILLWWPAQIKQKWSKKKSFVLRSALVIILLFINFLGFKSPPKSSIYISEDQKNELYTIYDNKVKNWPEETEDIYLKTEYGIVHILACGSENNPPLIMIHAASMGAFSWLENLEPLLDDYRIYSFDNIGEGNKSELNDALIYPNSGKELADLYAEMADELGIKSCPVLGASNGGFIAQNYTFYYPEKVEKLVLFGPMGLTKLKVQSIIMMGATSVFPIDFVRHSVTQWAIGDNEKVLTKYGDWFNCILRGTIPSLAQPVPMTTEQKKAMDLPVLLFLGTKDAIVGDAEVARKIALEYPNIQIDIYESGHLIAVEKASEVNKKLRFFLNNSY